MTVQIAVRLPEDLISQLDALVPGAHESRSQAVRRAIEEGILALRPQPAYVSYQ